ncbi:MAG: magnesium transporter, partial [Nitrospinaceae bacterium]|nr:magnesium transporter [Nitrospinaceae bacterium]
MGAWMEALLPVVPETATVKEALRTAKKLGPQLTDSLFVIDPNDRVAGKIPLTRLVVARGSLRVSDL